MTLPKTTWAPSEKAKLLVKRFEKTAKERHTKPARQNGANEELRAVGVFARVRHRQGPSSSVLQLEVLVGEGFSVDALASGSVASSKVSSLKLEGIVASGKVKRHSSLSSP
jgi:hypothetical protein